MSKNLTSLNPDLWANAMRPYIEMQNKLALESRRRWQEQWSKMTLWEKIRYKTGNRLISMWLRVRKATDKLFKVYNEDHYG